MGKDNTIGDKIKQLRKAKGLTQEELAELIEIDNKHLSRIEKGYHSPNYTVMQKLAQVLEFDFFSMNGIKVKTPVVKDKIITKLLHIYNKAESEEEKQCYLEAVKQVQKCFRICKQSKP